MKRYIAKGGIFFICLFMVLSSVLRVLSPKGGSGIYDLKEFYTLEDNSIDVLMLGSSLSFINIDPAVLYESEGIAAYTLGGAIQPLWNTYYYLEEALKTQEPKLITLEIYCAQEEYEPTNGYVLNNTFAIKSPVNKFRAIISSTTPKRWIPMFVGVPYYHDRYSHLSSGDYLDYRGLKDFEYYLGHGTYFKTVACERPNNRAKTNPSELPQKSEEYLIKIIELCKSKNIDLLLFASPTASYPSLKDYYLTVENIASDYGIKYVDFNAFYDEIGLDFKNDFADENHLNQDGCPKFSLFFAEYLSKNYCFPDCRGNGRYLRWDKAVEFKNASYQDYCLSKCDNLENHLREIQNCAYGDVVDYIFITGDESDDLKEILKKFNIPTYRGIYTYSKDGIDELPLKDDKCSFDFGHNTYICSPDYLIRDTSRMFDSDGNLAIVSFDFYTMKLFDSAVFNEFGEIENRPIAITWSWVGTGD